MVSLTAAGVFFNRVGLKTVHLSRYDFIARFNTPEALDTWLKALHKKVKGRISVAIELKKGPVVFALQKYPFITVFTVHALSLVRYRQTFWLSGAKDDPQDAELALELMLRYPKKSEPLIPTMRMDIRLLQQLGEQRRQLIEEKRRFVNRLINTLKQYYPQLLEWLSHRGILLLCELITRLPSLQQLKRARSNTVHNCINAKGVCAIVLTGQRVASIDDATR